MYGDFIWIWDVDSKNGISFAPSRLVLEIWHPRNTDWFKVASLYFLVRKLFIVHK